jgi:hypothetical protein
MISGNDYDCDELGRAASEAFNHWKKKNHI